MKEKFIYRLIFYITEEFIQYLFETHFEIILILIKFN